jgi:hypothetical protein
MPKDPNTRAVADAYRVINDTDPETKTWADRLRRLHKRTGEDPEVSERAIAGILESGPGAAVRLQATYDAVAKLHGLTDEEDDSDG